MHLISVDLKEKIDLEESFRRKLKNNFNGNELNFMFFSQP